MELSIAVKTELLGGWCEPIQVQWGEGVGMFGSGALDGFSASGVVRVLQVWLRIDDECQEFQLRYKRVDPAGEAQQRLLLPAWIRCCG